MRLDISNIQEALKEHDSWIEGVSRILMQMQEKVENLTEDIINLKNETADWRKDVSNTLQQMQETEENLTEDIIKVTNLAWKTNTKIVSKVDNVAWKEANDNLEAGINAARDIVCEIMSRFRDDITAVKTNLEEAEAKITVVRNLVEGPIRACSGLFERAAVGMARDLGAERASREAEIGALAARVHEVRENYREMRDAYHRLSARVRLVRQHLEGSPYLP